jgi:hypothetical protein
MGSIEMCTNAILRISAFAVLAVFLSETAAAQDDQAAIDATHEQLRALKNGAQAAFNALGESGKMEELMPLLALVDENIVLVAMNGETVTGKNGIRDYFMRTRGGPKPTVKSVHHDFKVAALSTLYGDDTAVAHGTSLGDYALTDSLSFKVDTFWTATMVKQGDQWLLASFQFAPSIFDNPLLTKATGMMYFACAGTAVIGLLLGLWIGRISGKKRAAA